MCGGGSLGSPLCGARRIGEQVGGSHILGNTKIYSSLTTIPVQVWFGAETRGEGVEGTDKEVETALRKIANVFSRPLFIIIVIIIILSIGSLDYCYWTLISLLEVPCTLADHK